MHIVGLVSGGKDSFYSLAHCAANGHTLVALANVRPRHALEADSFMFQTVGHTAVDAYLQCLGVPMHRSFLCGGSTNTNLEYAVTLGDEIEDLYALLAGLKRTYPAIAGVLCGAILSHYQRTRVENVCDRLGLVSLCYLWGRTQLELLAEMCVLRVDARLIKVAAAGLHEGHLGKLLLQMQPHLTRISDMYDVHVCGEGGEYETLVFDMPLFVKRLQLKESRVVKELGDVAYLDLEVTVADKPKEENAVVVPPLILDVDIADVPASTPALNVWNDFTLFQSIYENSRNRYFANFTSNKDTVEAQAEEIFTRLSEHTPLSLIQHITLIVRDLANFNLVNDIYSKFFDFILPPSRVCVELFLPQSVHLMVSAIAPKNFEKLGIHIRSLSYWAPRNIGPYSQAIVSQNTATLSGQIPLVPATMELCSHSPQECAALSLQHLHRVKSLINIENYLLCVCFVTGGPEIAIETWKKYTDSKRLLVVRVRSLPRGATIEWAGTVSKDLFGGVAASDTFDESCTRVYASPRNWRHACEFVPVDACWDCEGTQRLYGMVFE